MNPPDISRVNGAPTNLNSRLRRERRTDTLKSPFNSGLGDSALMKELAILLKREKSIAAYQMLGFTYGLSKRQMLEVTKRVVVGKRFHRPIRPDGLTRLINDFSKPFPIHHR